MKNTIRKNTWKTVALLVAVLLAGACTNKNTATLRNTPSTPPNIILVFIDDMGWGDFSCFGNTKAKTPNIDRIASEGIRFHQFYVNSPICSPSRVAISTGQYPYRHDISSYLAHRNINSERGIAQWLNPEAPMLARRLQNHGYATGHFGKWHMGGQRDVTDAPPIISYGFDASVTNFEGLGAKILPIVQQPDKDNPSVFVEKHIWDEKQLGGPITYMNRWEVTTGFIDRAILFMDKAKAENKPFYINIWPDDVHTPMHPSIDRWSKIGQERYVAVLEQMDMQFGKLFDKIRADKELAGNTLLLICSDNGPDTGMGSAGPFKGTKATLYEGGIRSPLVVWGPAFTNDGMEGKVNTTSVFAAIDLAPSLSHVVGAPLEKGVKLDGEILSKTLLGQSLNSRSAPLFFRRPPDRKNFGPSKELPDLAMREGKWKLLCDFDGGRPELYDLETDPSETRNLATQHQTILSAM